MAFPRIRHDPTVAVVQVATLMPKKSWSSVQIAYSSCNA